MILSNKQLSVAKRELERLQVALSNCQNSTDDANAWLVQIESDALKSQIADIEVEIQEYELLRDRQIAFSESYSLADLPRILVQARIAKSWSQTELAEMLGMKQQQIQRYEANSYLGASLSRLIEIADALDVQVAQSFSSDHEQSGAVLSWRSLDDVAWERFPAKEMVKRGWFEPQLGQSLVAGVRAYVETVAGGAIAGAHHRKKLRGKNLPDEIALLAWQVRVLDLAHQKSKASQPPEFDHNEAWVRELVALSTDAEGPSKVSDMLWRHGVILVTEPHLPGSYLDGAAMLSPSDNPVIALTLRFDRLDNFWFVLLHELGHVFRHLFDHTHFDFFDEEGPTGDDMLEREADKFALDMLVPPDAWDACLSRFALSENAVRLDAERLNIHPSILAGRIRRERNDYTILTNLVGQGEVHRQLGRG